MDAHGIEYSTDGITVVRGVLTPAQVETLRSTIYDYVAGGGDHVRTHAFGNHGGWYVGGVHHIEELTHAVQQLHASARLHRALSKLMGGSRSYRMLSRNEVYIDRYGTWHADTVIGKYIAYQAPDARGADGQKCREPLGCLWTKLSNGETCAQPPHHFENGKLEVRNPRRHVSRSLSLCADTTLPRLRSTSRITSTQVRRCTQSRARTSTLASSSRA